MMSSSWIEHRLFSKLTWALLAFNGSLFAILLILLGVLQQPTGDDLLYLKATLESGPWHSTLQIRDEWNTRWASVLMNQTLLYSIPTPWLGITYQLITLMLGTMAFVPFTKFILGRDAGLFKRWTLAMFLLLLLYIFTFGGSDSWFWLCSTPAYLWSGFAAIMALGQLTSTTNWRSVVIGVTCSLYAGGSVEVISFSLIIAFASFLIFKNKLGKMNLNLLLLFGVCLLVSMAFCLLGDGVAKRFNALGHPSLFDGIFLGFKNYIKVLVYGIGPKLGIAALASITLFNLRNKPLSQPCVDWKFGLGVADLVLILTSMMFAFVMNELGPNRGYVNISICLLMLVLIITTSNRSLNKHSNFFPIAGFIFNLGISAWLLYLISVDLPEQRRFSEEVNQRKSCVQEQLNDNKKVVHVSPLKHESTFLYYQELSENPEHWANKQLSTFHGQEIEFVLDPTGKNGC